MDVARQLSVVCNQVNYDWSISAKNDASGWTLKARDARLDVQSSEFNLDGLQGEFGFMAQLLERAINQNAAASKAA